MSPIKEKRGVLKISKVEKLTSQFSSLTQIKPWFACLIHSFKYLLKRKEDYIIESTFFARSEFSVFLIIFSYSHHNFASEFTHSCISHISNLKYNNVQRYRYMYSNGDNSVHKNPFQTEHRSLDRIKLSSKDVKASLKGLFTD